MIETRIISPSNDLSPSNSDEESEATLRLLGDNHIRPSKSFDTSTRAPYLIDDLARAISQIDPSKNLSPSKRQRSRGKGSGSVHYRTIKKKHKEYKQAYYHYEIWQKGDRIIKSSEYIPKKMETKIIGMNNEKAPVEEILKVLRDTRQRKKG